jgi:opacity protein-like surface antigen
MNSTTSTNWLIVLNQPSTKKGETHLLGYQAGVLSEVDLSKKLYMRGEVLYSVKGWAYATVQEGRSMNLHYLSLPVLLAYRPTAKISLLAGPEVGYLLQAVKKPATFLNFSDLYQKWDLGLTLGASYAFTSRLGVDLRYSYGMKAISEVMLMDENGNPTKLDKDGYNQALQLGLFYRWGKGSKAYFRDETKQ